MYAKLQSLPPLSEIVCCEERNARWCVRARSNVCEGTQCMRLLARRSFLSRAVERSLSTVHKPLRDALPHFQFQSGKPQILQSTSARSTPIPTIRTTSVLSWACSSLQSLQCGVEFTQCPVSWWQDTNVLTVQGLHQAKGKAPILVCIHPPQRKTPLLLPATRRRIQWH